MGNNYDNISYIDLDESELMHWKYIKREKLPNGKWRYYYDESELKKYEDNVKTTRALSFQAAAKVNNLQKDYDVAAKARNTAWYKHGGAATTKDKMATYQIYSKAAKAEATAKNKLDAAKKSHKYFSDLANRSIKQYEGKKITSLPERIISKGIVAVANWLNKIR